MEKFVPKLGERYWYVDFSRIDMVGYDRWDDYNIETYRLNSCGCYRTKEEAEKVAKLAKLFIDEITKFEYDDMEKKAKEMLGIYEIDGVEYMRGEWVEVSGNGIDWYRRMFYSKIDQKNVCISKGDEMSLVYDESFETCSWEYIRKLLQPTKPSMVGKTVEVKVDGVTYTAEIKKEG